MTDEGNGRNATNTINRMARLLGDCLSQHFGVIDPDFHAFIEDNCEYIDLFTGDTLLHQGDPSDDVYFLLSGHLRALVSAPDGSQDAVGDIGRGETIGELAIFTGRPRGANVVAIRDSVAAKISRTTLETAISKQPAVALKITKQIIERYERQSAISKPPAVPVNLTLLPITPGIDMTGFAARLADIRRAKGDNILTIGADYVRSKLGGLEQPDTALPRGPVSLALGELELTHDSLYFVAEPADKAWCHTAVHHSDEIVLVANASHAPDLSEIESLLFTRPSETRAPVTLVLLHEQDTQSPRDTGQWLRARNVRRHVHVRKGLDRDFGRLSRILSGRAVGVVLAGGGARGFAHLGILAALGEMGVEIDMVGGTSAGAIMGSFVAMDISGPRIIEETRDVFLNSPYGNISGDFNPVPILSLIKGQRAWKVTRKAVMDHAGADIDIEDSWKPFFTIASNYSTKTEHVLDRGNFARNVVASFSIPGLMPPVMIGKHTLFDGGSFNNFPVDEMRRRGAGKIIGIDLLSDFVREHETPKVPPMRSLLRDMARPKRKKKYHLPSLPQTLMTASVVTSIARQKSLRDHVDLLFSPEIRGVGMLDWKKYDSVVSSTREKALEQLGAMSDAELNPYRP